MERNKESARRCRLKKKKKMETMHKQLELLNTEKMEAAAVRFGG